MIRAYGADVNTLNIKILSRQDGTVWKCPGADFRIRGIIKVAREPHRYSGRTAMHAHTHVSEEKPPEDPDSPLSYTMEGYRGKPPSSMIPFFWSPGWNSVQSINKYQEEVGGSLRGDDPSLYLREASLGSSQILGSLRRIAWSAPR